MSLAPRPERRARLDRGHRRRDPDLGLRVALGRSGGGRGLHDLHVWQLTSEIPLLTAHVELEVEADSDRALDEMCRICAEEYGIEHSAIQPERRTREREEPEL